MMTQIQISGYVINELLSNIKEKSQKSDWSQNSVHERNGLTSVTFTGFI